MPGVKLVTDTQSDWQQGTLDGVVATAAGDLELWRPDVYGPFDANFNLVRKDDTTVAPLSGHVATLRPGEGRFGGAVAVEEGTTNLVYDSGTIFLGTHISPDELPAPPPVTPVFCYTWTDLNWRGDIELAKTFQAGDVVTISGWIYESGPWARLSIYGTENGTGRNFGHAFEPTGQIGWHYFEKTVVFQGETTRFRIEDGGWDYHNPDRADESQIWLVNVQIEEKPFATSFVAGTRAAGKLMYPGAIPSSEGTLLIWAKKNTLEPNTRDRWRKILDAQLPRIDLQWSESGNLSANFGGASLSIPDPAQDLDWHQYAITYSGRTVKMYFDGQLVASGQAEEDLVNFSELCVGARWDGRGAGNALYDELIVLPYAASEEEIQRWYAQSLPLRRASSGTRASQPIDLSPVGTAEGSSISWTATTPEGTSVTVETNLSLDGGVTWQGWQQATNGGAIPGITPGMDLSNARLQTRQTLVTADTTVTPRLHSLTVDVPVAGSASAPALVQVGVPRSVAPPVPVSVGLEKAVSGPVLVRAGLAKVAARGLRVYAVAVSRRVPASRHIRARLNIGRPDGATWQDVTDYLASARVSLGDVRALGTGSEGVDERVRMATFVLRQDRVPGGPSLSPRDRTSPWNQWDGQYAPLVWPRRQVLFDCCVESIGDVPPSQHETRKWVERVGFGDGTTLAFQLDRWPVEPGSEVVYVNGVAQQRGTDYTIDYATGQVTFATAPPAGLPITADYTYWLPIFEGFIDDWRTDGPTVEFSCRDMAAVLQDAYIESAHTYGSAEGTPLEEVIQQILDDNLGVGAVQLYCPRSPGFAVRPYNVEYQSVWDAIQSAVSKTIGWYLGYWLDPITNRFRLTLLEPPRNKTAADADWELDYRDDIYVDDLGGSIADVRNAVRVTFRNAATGKRETITVEDSASIAEYGRRAMQIEEADASLINTPEEAMALAVAAVADLKDQHATANLELPLLPMLNVMDGVVVRDDRVSSEPDFFAVESVEHTLDFDGGRFRTTAVCSGRVVGAHTRWMEMQTRPGAQQPTRMVSADAVEVTQAQPPQPVGVFANGTLAGIEAFVPAPSIRNWRLTRVRLKTAPGGVAIDTQESRGTRFVFTNVVPGATYYVDAQYEDTELQTGPWSDEVSVIAGGLASGIIVMWSGTLDELPYGFALCDGGTYQAPDGRQVTTPDLRDKFIVGAGRAYPVGSTGGSTSHAHTYSGNTSTAVGGRQRKDNAQADSEASLPSHYHTYSGTTSTESHLPPYYALAFIMKL